MHIFIQGDIHVSTFSRLSIVSAVSVSILGCIIYLCKCIVFSCFHQDCYILCHISLIVLVILAILGQDIKILSCNACLWSPWCPNITETIFFCYHPMLWRSNYEACTTETPLGMLRIKVLQQVEKVTAGIYSGVLLMLKLMYFICKELLGLLPKPLSCTSCTL